MHLTQILFPSFCKKTCFNHCYEVIVIMQAKRYTFKMHVRLDTQYILKIFSIQKPFNK